MSTPRPHTLGTYLVLVGKDVRREFRTREMLTSMGVYALLVLIVYGAALAQVGTKADLLQMSGGLIWALIVFTSLLGLNRSFAYEQENGCLEGLLLAPVDRGAVFLAKATSNLLFLLVVELVALPLFWFFFMGGKPVARTLALAVAPLVLGTLGMASVGTLLATITARTRGRDVMLAVLFVPLVFPLLYVCVSATTGAIVGNVDGFGVQVACAAGYDVIMTLVSWVLYPLVLEG